MIISGVVQFACLAPYSTGGKLCTCPDGGALVLFGAKGQGCVSTPPTGGQKHTMKCGPLK